MAAPWWGHRMGSASRSLRLQVMTLLSVLAAPSLLVLLGVLPALAEGRFRQIEQEQVKLYTQSAREELATEQRRVSLLTLRFSRWDPAFEYTAGRNPAFPALAFGVSAFLGGQIDYGGVRSPAGTLLTALQLRSGQVVGARQTVEALLAQLPDPLPPGGAAGLVQVGPLALVVAGRPITRDDGTGRGGVLVLARELSPVALSELMPSQRRYSAQLLPAPAGRSWALTFRPRDVVGVTPLPAPGGLAQLALRLTIPREVYRAGQQTLWQLRAVTLLVTLGVIVALTIFLNRRVLRVLAQYVQDTRRIARDPAHRLDASNPSELGVLARTINDLLDHLQGQEAQWRERSRRDDLTGAYSRAGLNELLRDDPAVRSALLVEVPRLQELSGLYGGAFVDRLITELAQRLGEHGSHVVGRVGSGTLALITRAPDRTDPAQVLARLTQPFALREGEVTLKLVAGFSRPAPPVAYRTLVRQANLALQHAIDHRKHLGRFSETLLRRSQYNHLLETQLQGAAARQEVSLTYQPIVEAQSGEWVAVEALLRWRHPQLGAVPPGAFIPVAERSGQIYELGDWALRRALSDVPAMQDVWPGAHVNVNVSPVQLLMPDYAERVLGTLARLQVVPSCVTVEVTESTVLQHMDLACRHLTRLRQAGVRVALDDFGSGQSGLSLLTDLPLDSVKLDRSFLRSGAHSGVRGALLRNTIRLARDLQLSTVVEGVETPGSLALLRDLGCECVQGFFIARPEPLSGLLARRS